MTLDLERKGGYYRGGKALANSDEEREERVAEARGSGTTLLRFRIGGKTEAPSRPRKERGRAPFPKKASSEKGKSFPVRASSNFSLL